MCGSSFDDERIAVFARQQNLSVKGDRRSSKSRGNGDAAALILYFTSSRIEARENSAIGGQVEIIAVQNRRRNIGGSLRIFPSHRVNQIARASQLNRHRNL